MPVYWSEPNKIHTDPISHSIAEPFPAEDIFLKPVLVAENFPAEAPALKYHQIYIALDTHAPPVQAVVCL